ncbi:hypothetical protein E4U44_001729 [Claviceps purpurea]|nr:hypothetical protein E4U44_001729 [Claviceps purpurea]
MVRTSLVASLLAAAASSLAAKSVVPGAYIFELENGQDVSAFEQAMTGDGKTRMKLEYDLFTGLSGITGKGIKVAVIDSGIDCLHPALGGCYGKDCLISFGHDFVGDDYIVQRHQHASHGSHVAGIIAAQKNTDGFTGTAPGVSLGAYRVFGCSGSGGNDVLIAAFNKAYQDGANIITASIGGSSGWAQDVWADAVSRIVDKGIPCVHASSPADGQHVSAIASFDNVQKPSILHMSKYQVDDGPEQSFGYVPSKLSNSWDGVNLPAWASSLDPTIKNDACAPLGFPCQYPGLSNFIVLVRRRTCSFFSDKAHNAIDKGAKYVLFYNDAPGVAFEVKFDAPAPGAISAASMVDAETGETFIKALKGGKKLTLKMVGPKNAELRILTANNTMSGGAVSAFSSWGPTFEMRSKPQYGAIGGTVLSTFPRAKGSYAVPSGTSMACPQAAGIIVLIRQVRGAITPQEIEDLLSSNSNPQLFNDGTKFYDYLAPIQQQGGGLSLEFTLRNTDRKPATYKITHVPAITMYSLQPFPNEAVHAAATLQFSETSITLRGGQTKTIKVSATPPEGSLHEHVVLGSNDTWISRSTDKDPSPSPVPSNTTFTVPGPGNAGPNDLLPQLSTIGQPYALPAHWQLREHNGFPWDGRLDSGSYAPPGTYKFVVRALRVNGDETKKEDWDVSTSPAVSIKYL